MGVKVMERYASAGPRTRYAIALAPILLIALGVGGYFLLGESSRDKVVDPVAAESQPAGGQALEVVVEKLRSRLQSQPDDPEGWAMLGLSYMELGQYGESAKAYAKANELSEGQQPDWLVNEGEAYALSRDRNLLGRPQQLFAQALALAPEHGKALWYLGLASEQAGDLPAAKRYWVTLSKQKLPQAVRVALDERLQSSQQSAKPLIHAGDAPQSGSARLKLRVSVKPELLRQFPPGAAFFVFAKASQGPPMPLAVYRGLASELPREIILDDSMAMMPALKLSQFDRWTVTARVTSSGQVKAQSGDIEGTQEVSQLEAGSPVTVVIDRKVP